VSPFWLAWTFLTTFPGPGRGPATMTEFVKSRIWYPVVGVGLGALWWAVAQGAALVHAPSGVAAFAVLAAMLWSTGFLHLDGLLDSGDALLVPKSPEDRLRILKDVHLGSFAFGVGSLWMVGMFAALSSLRDPLLLLALPVFSRAAMLLPIHMFPYARALPEDPSSLSGASPATPRFAWLLPISVGAVVTWLFPVEAATALVVQLGVGLWAARRLGGGITGDVYGAGLVVSELAALLVHSLPGCHL